MAITNLSRRLTKLEGRFGIHSEPLELVINFVDADGTVASTLTLKDGREDWWHAPGHAPAESESRVIG